MLPGMEMLACPNLAVPPEVMQHVVQVESGANPFAIGVVNGRLARQPRNMDEALATARMLEGKGYNFSVGIAQVNRANLGRYGLDSYRKAFTTCDNLAAGAQILAGCHASAHGDWGKAFSCYYSGNFTTGFRDGYVQKVYASINRETARRDAAPSHSASAARPVPAMVTTTVVTAASSLPSSGMNSLRPMVVYSSDSARYRTALRSIAIELAAGASTPLVVSAATSSAHVEPLLPPTAVAQDASHGITAAAARSPTPHEGNRPPRAIPELSRAAAAGGSPASDGGVFVPRVRGANEPSTSPTTVTPGSTKPVADGADLRLEHGDGALVF